MIKFIKIITILGLIAAFVLILFARPVSSYDVLQYEQAETYDNFLSPTPESRAMALYYDERLFSIIECESGWNPKAQNPVSTAGGLAQFIDGTWEIGRAHV